ncbi:MAG: zinc ribbon domain-containing protein, partial [Thermoplasmata archaeon]
HEHRSFEGLTKEQVMQAAGWFWRSRQFGVNYTSPYSVHCELFYSRLGLRQSVDLYAVDEEKKTGVAINFSAELTDEGAILGAVGAVLILPVAAVVGAVSYVEYENDAQRLTNEFWNYLGGFSKNPQPPSGPISAPSWAQAQPPQVVLEPKPAFHTRSCPSCGVLVEDDSKFCRHCGKKL